MGGVLCWVSGGKEGVEYLIGYLEGRNGWSTLLGIWREGGGGVLNWVSRGKEGGGVLNWVSRGKEGWST